MSADVLTTIEPGSETVEIVDLAGLLDAAADLPVPVLIGAAFLALLLIQRVLGPRKPRPARGEVWFAEVPFADGTGSKDRPVLVLAVDGSTCTVARFTSQDRTARRDHRRVPGSLPGSSRASWADLRPITLRRRAFRRRVARSQRALLRWYEGEAGMSDAA